MPIFNYTCSCTHTEEKYVSHWSERDEQICPKCGKILVFQYSPFASHFKGSGFYQTDYKKKEKTE